MELQNVEEGDTVKLSTAELEIMEQIWRLDGPVTAAALSGALQGKG